jgi:hypothetical protein
VGKGGGCRRVILGLVNKRRINFMPITQLRLDKITSLIIQILINQELIQIQEILTNR